MLGAYASTINHGVWSAVADSYAGHPDALFSAEQRIFAALRAELKAARLLDIGIGAGRSTAHLHTMCRDYVGIDYARSMVARARTRFRQLDLRVMDARDLSAFEECSFDAVVFSFNGIDYMAHEERLRVLREIHRVLRKGGVFVFSTHNRNSEVMSPYSIHHLRTPPGLARLPKNIARFGAGIINAARLKKLERFEDEYALINDMGERYRLLTYYITPQAQIAQLERGGFATVRLFSLAGRDISADCPEAATDYMLHVTARKADA